MQNILSDTLRPEGGSSLSSIGKLMRLLGYRMKEPVAEKEDLVSSIKKSRDGFSVRYRYGQLSLRLVSREKSYF